MCIEDKNMIQCWQTLAKGYICPEDVPFDGDLNYSVVIGGNSLLTFSDTGLLGCKGKYVLMCCIHCIRVAVGSFV